MGFFKIKGVIPPVITPFHPDGRVDFDAFVSNIKKWNSYDLAGYLVLGSNGETPYISGDDKLELIRLAVAHKAPGKLIMVGTGLESTAATIALTNKAAALGADCALLLTPNYYNEQMGDAAQEAYFTTVADHSDIPILIYNVTKFTHINISPKAVSALSAHPNIIGMKDSSGNIAQLMSFITYGLDPDFTLIVGTASAWYPALAIGVQAAVMATANCCPLECVNIQKLYEEGCTEASFNLYRKLFPVNACVTGKLGVPALKHACDILGYTGGYPAAPLLPLSDSEKQAVAKVIQVFKQN